MEIQTRNATNNMSVLDWQLLKTDTENYLHHTQRLFKPLYLMNLHLIFSAPAYEFLQYL